MTDQIIWQGIEYIFSLIESIMLFDFLSATLGKKANSFFYKGNIILYSIIVYLLSDSISSSNIRLIIVVLIFFGFALYTYGGTIKNKIILTFIDFILLVLCDIIVANILVTVMNLSLAEVVFYEAWYRVVLFCVSKLIFFIILKTVGYFFGVSKLDLPIKYWHMITAVFIVSLIILMMIVEIGLSVQDYQNKSIYLVFIPLGILITNIFMYYILILLNENYKKEQNYKMFALKNEMQGKYYLEREEVYKKTRKLGHDFKNHMLCVSSLLINEKYDEAVKYLDSISEESFKYIEFIETGNDIVDAVLNQKRGVAKKLHIDITINADVPKDLGIKSIDMCAILSNLLDNAIEASMRMKEENKRNINMKVNPYKGYLLILVSNNVDENEVVDIKTLKTIKKGDNHGLGSSIVKNAVEKYDGTIEYEYEDNIFTVKILIKEEMKRRQDLEESLSISEI